MKAILFLGKVIEMSNAVIEGQLQTLIQSLFVKPILRDDSNIISLSSNEIADISLAVSSDIRRGLSIDELLEDIKKIPEIYCPWMILALYFLPESETDILPEHKSILNAWIRTDIKQVLEKTLQYHFPDKKWELK